MNENRQRKILEYIHKSIWIKSIICFLICIVILAISENIKFSNQVLTFINLTAVGFMLLLIYVSIKEKEIPKGKFIFVFLMDFICNKFYDERVFYSVFHIPLVYFAVAASGVVLTLILINPIANLITSWMDIVQEDRDIKRQRNLKDKKKWLRGTERSESGSTGERMNSTEANQGGGKTTKEVFELNNKMPMNFWDKLLFVGIFILIIVVPCVVLFKLSTISLGEALQENKVSESIRIIISLVGFVILLIVIFASAIGMIIKLAYSLFDIVTKRNKKIEYFLVAGGFVILSTFLSKNYPFTLEDFYNKLSKGDIFSYPLVLVIILPIFLTFLENLGGYIRKHTEIKDDIVKLIEDIAKDTVISLLSFIKFITSDFLTSIRNLVKGDLLDDCEGTEEEKDTE